MTGQRNKRKLRKLHDDAAGLCHWCGAVTHIWTPPPRLSGHSGPKPPLDSATIDHLRDRYDPTRHVPPRNQERRLVLACWKCNNDRNRERQATLDRDELRRRSAHGRAA